MTSEELAAFEAGWKAAQAHALAPLRELFAGGPETSCRTVWDHSEAVPEFGIGPLECVSVPIDDLRDAFARAESAP